MYLTTKSILWHKYQRPRYKVWSDYAVMFYHANTTALVLQDIKLPFPVFSIMLPEECPLTLGGNKVSELAVSNYSYAELGKALPKNAILEGFDSYEANRSTLSVRFLSRFGGENTDQVARVIHLQHHRDETDGESFGESVQRALATDNDMSPEYKVEVQGWLNLAVTVSILATKTQLLVPEILNADVQRYLEAVNAGNTSRAEQLVERATKRRHARSWVIGKYGAVAVVGRYAKQCQSGDTGATGTRELKYSHVRSAHWHRHKTGVGRTEEKLMFHLPVVVRPDLPPPPCGTTHVVKV
jgi:hypothetical protein